MSRHRQPCTFVFGKIRIGYFLLIQTHAWLIKWLFISDCCLSVSCFFFYTNFVCLAFICAEMICLFLIVNRITTTRTNEKRMYRKDTTYAYMYNLMRIINEHDTACEMRRRWEYIVILHWEYDIIYDTINIFALKAAAANRRKHRSQQTYRILPRTPKKKNKWNFKWIKFTRNSYYDHCFCCCFKSYSSERLRTSMT